MAQRFHINPTTGDPGACRAEVVCPFGNSDLHYDSREQARKAYENSRETFENYAPFADVTTEELQNLEEESLRKHRREGTPLSDEEYMRHYELVKRIRTENPSTHKTFTTKVEGKMVYTEERRLQQIALLDDLEREFKNVPKNNQALITGGITGSGKTTALRKQKDLRAENYALISVDAVKEKMAEMKMTPEIPGVLPLETDDLIKFEATLLSKEFFDRLSSTGTNVVLDKTMAGEKPLRDEINLLRNRGYTKITAVFVDVDPVDAHERIRGRHKRGIDTYLETGQGYGERAVPGGAIQGAMTTNPEFRSKNAEVFHMIASENAFDEFHIFDSSKNGERLTLETLRQSA